MILLAAVTHTRPVDGVLAVEMPSAVKRHLGLDDNRSWIVVSEVNAVAWSDRGIVPVEADQWTYGELPPKLVRTLVDLVVTEFDAGRLHVIKRDQG